MKKRRLGDTDPSTAGSMTETERWSDLIRLKDGRYARIDYTDHQSWLVSEGLDGALCAQIVAWAHPGGFRISSSGTLLGMSDDEVLLRLLFDTAEVIEPAERAA